VSRLPCREFASRPDRFLDLYADDMRRPVASINFVTAHDGFTLARPGLLQRKAQRGPTARAEPTARINNRSWELRRGGRHGEGSVTELRRRQQRNLLATLLLSQGVPMLLGGDEAGRTQHGNNNAYCQDNETSWFDWANIDRRCAPSPAASSRCGANTPCCGASGGSRADRSADHRSRLVLSDGFGDDRGGLDAGLARSIGCSSTATR